MNQDMLTETLSGRSLDRFHRRVREKAENRAAAPVVIVAFGDSVTQGIGSADHLLHEDVYHARLVRGLQAAHPLSTFSVINAGVDGEAAPQGLARLHRDVIRYDPDLVLVAFGLNDAVAGQADGVGTYVAAVERIVTAVQCETEAAVVLVTPNMMLTRRNDAIAREHRQFVDILLATQRDGVFVEYVRALRELGERLLLPVADVYGAWEAMHAEGEDTTAMLSNGLNHPDHRGHQLAADVILNCIKS